MRLDKAWRRYSAAEYAQLFPAKPKALRKIAFALRKLGAGNQPFTMNEWELAKACSVSKRTLQRYLPLFESYGILEVKRWRYRLFGPSPNTYRVFLGNVIPADWVYGGGDFPISAVERRKKHP
jgi:response regulator of citrate/malate metabolism